MASRPRKGQDLASGRRSSTRKHASERAPESPAPTDAVEEARDERVSGGLFPIVGVGASAGGLEPAGRTPGNYRFYGPEARVRVTFIRAVNRRRAAFVTTSVSTAIRGASRLVEIFVSRLALYTKLPRRRSL